MDRIDRILACVERVENLLEGHQGSKHDYLEEMDLAEILHVSRKTIRRYRNSGILPCICIGRRYLYDMTEVRKLRSTIDRDGVVYSKCRLLGKKDHTLEKGVMEYIHRGKDTVGELARMVGTNSVCMECAIRMMSEKGKVIRTEDGLIRAARPEKDTDKETVR